MRQRVEWCVTVNLGALQGSCRVRAVLPLTVMMLTLAKIFLFLLFLTYLNLLFTFFLCLLQIKNSKAVESTEQSSISRNYKMEKNHPWHLYKNIGFFPDIFPRRPDV